MQQSLPNSAFSLGMLARRGWLSLQPQGFQDRIAAAGRFKSVSRGQLLYQVGDLPEAFYGLESGMLDVALPIQRNEEVSIHRAGPGFWIGDSAILAETARTISVTAATDCHLFCIPMAQIRQMLDARPDDWRHFYHLSHLNITLALGVLAEVLSLPPRARFARMLLRLVDDAGFVRVTQDDLARLAGMSRATFRRSFAALIDAGVVGTEYAALRILDRPALEAEAMQD